MREIQTLLFKGATDTIPDLNKLCEIAERHIEDPHFENRRNRESYSPELEYLGGGGSRTTYRIVGTDFVVKYGYTDSNLQEYRYYNLVKSKNPKVLPLLAEVIYCHPEGEYLIQRYVPGNFGRGSSKAKLIKRLARKLDKTFNADSMDDLHWANVGTIDGRWPIVFDFNCNSCESV